MTALMETDGFNEENGDHNSINNTLVGVPLVFIDNNNKKILMEKELPNEKRAPLQEDQDSSSTEQELDQDLGGNDEDMIHDPVEMKIKIKKSLLEFRGKVEDAILRNYLLGEGSKKLTPEELKDISLWGIPLLPSKGHEGTDIILLKFLKAKDYKVSEALDMLQKTLNWRIENRVDRILDEEDLGSEFEHASFLNSRDKEGRPVCYHLYGIFNDKSLYKKTFGTQQKRERFLRWRIQLMERAVRKLCFKEGGVDSVIQVYDLKRASPQRMKELESISKQALLLIQNYYPELVWKNIVLHAPFWTYTSQVLFSRFMSQRSKKKFILVRPQRITKTLLKFVDPEQLPVEYGGLRREKDPDFSPEDKAEELHIRGNTVSTVEFPVSESGVTVTWDVTVLGWDVSYKEEFVPDDEGSYTILLQNQNRLGESIRNSFYINEPGKIVLTIENGNYRKRRMFYRSKTRITVPMFILLSNSS
ncbi:hypothetical protein HN51_021640 [Arachis hypogaea]|uniref:patellin-4 n=1 Tax=Arachis hypogaea TaxID=3818 RepID=UPI000DECEA1A|nr:patellin-4 [Arachis hypogaea]QHO52748.1 uncharacterized protein DS421_2g41810 [Arachis hypogaea]